MNKTIDTTIPDVKLSTVEKLIQKIRTDVGNQDILLSFEFIIGSLFPTSWANMQFALNRQYTLGYIQGQEDKKI